ncbi:DUF3817 domain-containing protein [Flavobacterium sp. HSC-61S13]|uniref:DUF3817 domain-containing protein n=1 Tax=Flavobacterium sp. HSC-61S13 TaxID=2910963 RepID=UPI00209E1453|nr:DUF3817 domain-containing protein [Flavobacterium sp. HSC-61S13]MCP1995913.1 integral membrane protein [Flavobacterium sp. HSC-61S13]
MKHLLKNSVGQLRLIALLEGTSLLLLLFVAMPLKYFFDFAQATQYMGMIHGGLFLLFIFNTFSMSIEKKWGFKNTTCKILVACVIPFGTFYIDKTILSKLQ